MNYKDCVMACTCYKEFTWKMDKHISFLFLFSFLVYFICLLRFITCRTTLSTAMLYRTNRYQFTWEKNDVCSERFLNKKTINNKMNESIRGLGSPRKKLSCLVEMHPQKKNRIIFNKTIYITRSQTTVSS